MCYDGDPPAFFSSSTVRARKHYKCIECGAAISVGVQHERAVGKWEGDVSTIRTCVRCVRVREIFTRKHPDCALTFGGLYEELRDHQRDAHIAASLGAVR